MKRIIHKEIPFWVDMCGKVFDDNLEEINLQTDKLGYKKVQLHWKGKRVSVMAHRLVAIAYIPNTENKPHVNHKNGVKFDNRLENLEWVTPKENITHAWKMGLAGASQKRQRKEARHKLVRDLISKGYSREYLAAAFGVSETIITRIKHQDHFEEKLSRT